MLSSLLRATPKFPSTEPEPEDIFQYSLGLIFTDDLQIQHGDLGTIVKYRSNGYGDLEFEVADPQGEEERTKFAHYLWNAGVLMGEFVGGRNAKRWERSERRDSPSEGFEGGEQDQGQREEEWGKRKFREGEEWWLSEEEERKWSVKGEKVLELGAGVGLAGIVSTLAGAEEVTITDYPAPTIIQTLSENVDKNVPPTLKTKVEVEPHKWGDLNTPFALCKKGYYNRILAADTLWLSAQHTNLAQSMVHFLSPAAEARIYVIAGFHTGRARMASFFEETVREGGLEVEEIWEMDADGKRRDWEPNAPEETTGERNRWLVVARIQRR